MSSVNQSSPRRSAHSSPRGDPDTRQKINYCRDIFMEIAGKDRVIQRKEWKQYFANIKISIGKSEGLWRKLDKDGSGRITYAKFDEYISASVRNGTKEDAWLLEVRSTEAETYNKQNNEVQTELETKAMVQNDEKVSVQEDKDTLMVNDGAQNRTLRSLSGTSLAHKDDTQSALKWQICKERFMEIAGKDRVIRHKDWTSHFKGLPISSKKTNGMWKRLDKNGSGRVTFAEFDVYICDSIESGKKTDEWFWKGRLEKENEEQAATTENEGNNEVVDVDHVKPLETPEKTPEVIEKEEVQDPQKTPEVTEKEVIQDVPDACPDVADANVPVEEVKDDITGPEMTNSIEKKEDKVPMSIEEKPVEDLDAALSKLRLSRSTSFVFGGETNDCDNVIFI